MEGKYILKVLLKHRSLEYGIKIFAYPEKTSFQLKDLTMLS